MSDLQTYTNWDDIPDNLKTKTSLKKLGLKPKRGQKPVAIKRSTWHSTISEYKLYDMAEAVENTLSAKQKAAIEKAQQASLAARTCKRCTFIEELGPYYRGKLTLDGDGLCPHCSWQAERERDRTEAVMWARRFVDGLADGTIQANEVLILDSETTDLHGEIIELAMIDLAGETVYNQRFKPLSGIAPSAQAVHGISADDLKDCPTFAQEYNTITAALKPAGKVLIYNAEYDIHCLELTCELHQVSQLAINDECLMEWYAQFVGQWSDYWKSYRWQPLNGGHDALGDCQAALSMLHRMADADIPEK